MAAVAAAAIFQVPVFNPCWMAGGAATAAASSSLEKKEAIHFQATIPSRPAKLLPLRLRPRLQAAAGAVVPITIWLLTSLYAPACAPGWNHSGFIFFLKIHCVNFYLQLRLFYKNYLTALAKAGCLEDTLKKSVTLYFDTLSLTFWNRFATLMIPKCKHQMSSTKW